MRKPPQKLLKAAAWCVLPAVALSFLALLFAVLAYNLVLDRD